MKSIFLYLRSQLMALPSIRWVDLDKGQLNQYDARPSIDFPAVLLKIEYPNTKKLTGKDQQAAVFITATLVFDFMDDTDSNTPEDILMQSLEVYDIAAELHATLQGATDKSIRAPLERTSLRDPNRPDKLKTIIQTYTTSTIDQQKKA